MLATKMIAELLSELLTLTYVGTFFANGRQYFDKS